MNYILLTSQDIKLPGIEVIKPGSLGYAGAVSRIQDADSIALDIETTGLNPWMHSILLTAIYVDHAQWVLVIDNTTISIDLIKELLKEKLVLCHNSQFEYKFLAWRGAYIERTKDTMVQEAKLTQGSGFSVSLIETLKRRNIELPEGMDKNIALEFTKEEYKLEAKHIIYNASDVVALHELNSIQQKNAKVLNLSFFINSIHNPLSLILAKMSLQGFKHNSEKWIHNADKNEEKCNVLATQMNSTAMLLTKWKEINTDYATAQEKQNKGVARTQARITKLKAEIDRLNNANKTHLKAYEKTQAALHKAEIDFVDYTTISFAEYQGINWSSSKQVLEVLKQLQVTPLPMAKSATTHKIQPSVSAAARDRWLLENPEHKWIKFMTAFNDYSKLSHNVKSFGREWVNKYKNPMTNKVHTSYRQNAATGRLTSGDADQGLFNSQQIPADNTYRTCFYSEPGYDVATIDYSGAELCFMAALAEDDRLVELSKTDMHSYFANLGWAAIYNAKGLNWQADDYISKTQNKQQRTDYKPMMFGVVYGLKAPKAAETLNVDKVGGQIAIDTITKEIPKTIKFVENASYEAIANGFVIHNKRTNSRRWFMDAYRARSSDQELPFKARMVIEGQARNSKIQASQADMVMEALVAIQRWIDLYRIDAQLLITVHDEIVAQYNQELQWFPGKMAELMERIAAKYMKGFLELRVDCVTGISWKK